MISAEVHDVIVIGSGGAGLVAALTTAAAGLDTLLIERTDLIGGTTAMSGAGLWVPGNALAGNADSPAEALAYIRAVSPDGWQSQEDDLWQAFAAAAPRMLDFVAAKTPLRFALSDDPDPYPLAPGARLSGRMVSPLPLPRAVAGPWAGRLRPPHIPHVLTYQETRRLDPWHHPLAASLRLLPRLALRVLTGRRGQGTALVAGLVAGFLGAGGHLRAGTRALRLIRDGAVEGVIVERDGGQMRLDARLGIVLTTGGFERDAARRGRHFTGPVDLIASAPGNTGDGHDMAEAVGARLARMDQANIAPALPARLRGAPLPIATFHHREPGAILIGPDGRRFVNEYTFNLGEVLARRRADGTACHLPAWLLTDRKTLAGAPVLRHLLGQSPGWALSATDLPVLAGLLGVDPRALTSTLAAFNTHAARGQDPLFQRHLDPVGQPAPERLRPIRPPYVALPFNLSFLSTKGGPRTDAQARVLDTEGKPIPGLYCAGVAMANPFGTRAVGSGTTIGPNMTWGWIAAQDIIARRNRSEPQT